MDAKTVEKGGGDTTTTRIVTLRIVLQRNLLSLKIQQLCAIFHINFCQLVSDNRRGKLRLL